MSEKKPTGNRKGHPPTNASRQAMHRIAQPRWATETDGYLPITAPVVRRDRGSRELGYVSTDVEAEAYARKYGRLDDND